MRRLTALLSATVLSFALVGCGSETASPTARRTSASTPAAVPGTRPSTATPSPVVSGPAVASDGPTPSAPPPPSTSPVDVEVSPSVLDGYRALSAAVNGFFAAVQRVEDDQPGAEPANAEEMKALVGYEFPKGVDLVGYSTKRICFLGPDDTHLVFATDPDTLRQLLGTGACRYDDGDVVVDITFDFVTDGDLPKTVYHHRVVKGGNVAARIPGLHAYLDLLNTSM